MRLPRLVIIVAICATHDAQITERNWHRVPADTSITAGDQMADLQTRVDVTAKFLVFVVLYR